MRPQLTQIKALLTQAELNEGKTDEDSEHFLVFSSVWQEIADCSEVLTSSALNRV